MTENRLLYCVVARFRNILEFRDRLLAGFARGNGLRNVCNNGVILGVPIGVGTTGYPALPPPNRACGSPAHGSPVGGSPPSGLTGRCMGCG